MENEKLKMDLGSLQKTVLDKDPVNAQNKLLGNFFNCNFCDDNNFFRGCITIFPLQKEKFLLEIVNKSSLYRILRVK